MMEKLPSKRATRGLRMAALVGEAADADETFWGDNVWDDSSEDESFEEEEIKPDVFDSDFNDTEDDEESTDQEEEEKEAAAKEKFRKAEKGTKYKEPVSKPTRKKEAANDAGTAVVRESRPPLESSAIAPSRHLRDSTKTKSLITEINREQAELIATHTKVKRRAPIKHSFTQQGLLLDALETEKLNQTWLESQKHNLQADNVDEKVSKRKAGEDCIRHLSRRGAYNTVTFPDAATMPTLFFDPPPIPPQPKICAVTGLPARYFDPVTRLPYYDKDAFKELRRRYL